MKRSIAALTIALMISAGTEAEAQIAPPEPVVILPEQLPDSAGTEAQIVPPGPVTILHEQLQISAGTEAEAQTGKWEAFEYYDSWGDLTGEKAVRQIAGDLLVIDGDSMIVTAAFVEDCRYYEERTDFSFFNTKTVRELEPRNQYIVFVDRKPILLRSRRADYSVHSKEDGEKGRIYLNSDGGERFGLDRITEARESLEILFARGSPGQPPQSLTWSMDGLREAYAEACGEELDAGEE